MQSYVSNITSAATLLSPPESQPLAFVNVAFSHTGLAALDVPDLLGDSFFTGGQFADAASLGDDVSQWEEPYAGTSLHGVFLIGSDQVQFMEYICLHLLITRFTFDRVHSRRSMPRILRLFSAALSHWSIKLMRLRGLVAKPVTNVSYLSQPKSFGGF